MNRFQLFLDTQNCDLFNKAACDLGTIFYRTIDRDNFEIVYFSGSRIARFKGLPDEKMMKLCTVCGFEVDLIEVDEVSGTVKIIQKGEKP